MPYKGGLKPEAALPLTQQSAGDDNTAGEITRAGSVCKQFYRQNEQHRLKAILNAINYGNALTSGEKTFLLNKNPALYAQALNLERMRDSYKRELRKCKVNEDADRLCISGTKTSCEAAAPDRTARIIPLNRAKSAYIKAMVNLTSTEASGKHKKDMNAAPGAAFSGENQAGAVPKGKMVKVRRTDKTYYEKYTRVNLLKKERNVTV